MRYEKPYLSLEGDSTDLVRSFGGSYKNPSVADTQDDGTQCPAGLCPSEADE